MRSWLTVWTLSLLVSVLFLSSSISVFDERTNLSAGNAEEQPRLALQKHSLARVFNEDTLDYDRAYALKYLTLRHNFSDILFKNFTADKEDFSFSMGNRPDDVRGFKLRNNNYAIQVVYCDRFQRFCKFRINGVLTPNIYLREIQEADKATSFNIDGVHELQVRSVQFDLCDNHRFCHLGYEGYDVIDVTIGKRGAG